MKLRLSIGFVSLGCAVTACSGEVDSADHGSPVQGQAGSAGALTSGGGGSSQGGASGGSGQGVGSGGSSQSGASGGSGQGGGSGGSRMMGTAGSASAGQAGSGGSTGIADAGQPTGSTVVPTDADLQFCVDENNRYRATVASPPLARSSALEAFATIGAQVDYAARTAHSHFTTSKGIPGARASGENEIPGFGGWNLNGKTKTLHDVIAAGLLDMWNEGPGGGHYENMKSTKFTQLGCGVFVAANRDVTVTMDYTN